MPYHNSAEDKSIEVESSIKPEKKELPKRKSGMRKLEDKEKEIMRKHLDLHMKDASKSDKAKMRMKLMRSAKPVKSMKGLHSLLSK